MAVKRLQESVIIHDLDQADRFIPNRSCMGTIYGKITNSNNKQDSILNQDVSENHLEIYKKHLEAALNMNSKYSRLLKYSRRSFDSNMLPNEEYQWPTRCRKRPLIKKPHHLLDMPNFRTNFFMNQLDWGPSSHLAAALHNTVYLYAMGYEPIQLTWFERVICSAVKWNHTGDKVILGTNHSHIEVWNTNTKKRENKMVCYCIEHELCIVNTLIWHPNNVWCASGCSLGRLHVMRLDTKRRDTFPLAHYGQICSLRSSADGRLLASAGEDGLVKVRNWRTMKVLLEIRDYNSPIRAIAWHPWKASCLVVGGSDDGTLSVWNVNNRSKEMQQLDPGACVCSLEFSAVTGELVASVSVSGPSEHMESSVIVVMKNITTVVDRMECQAGQIYHMAWNHNGREFAIVGSDETLRITHFLGPSSARTTNLRRYLKPIMPLNYNVPEFNKKQKKQILQRNVTMSWVVCVPTKRGSILKTGQRTRCQLIDTQLRLSLYITPEIDQNDTSKGQIVPAKMEFIRDSGFKCNYPTLIFIHDFTSHGWAGWIKKTVQGVLGIMNWNIYSVDWEFGARPPYAQAVSNARVVALEIMYLLKILQSDFKVDMKDVHIIGHGVGAHIAGYVGGNIRGLGKITALDPSGPYFHGMPACTRLDITDACIVQVIHTDTFCTKGETGQGIPEPLGHYDFYPNAGYNQPGCEENVEYPSLLKVTEDNLPPGNILPGCSHKRALKYMKEALLNPECPMMGFRCRNKEAFLNGQCTTCGENSVNCVPFHILNNKYPKPELGTRYFFKTNSSSPFCLYPYSIALELTVPDQVSDMLEGTVSIKLQQNKEMIELDFVNTWPQKFEQGGIKSLLGYNSAPKFSEVDHCEVTWQGVGSFFHKASSVLRITAVYVTSLGSYPPSNMSTKLCSCHNKDHTEIASGQSAVFVKCSTVPTFDVRSSLN